ncbi:MAG TPA: SDR family oxidoreductase [Stellaceae bacterium]|jgi:NAD(P)-dependent dehydrogenase (short-subunit alcohol dehydrogenase family)
MQLQGKTALISGAGGAICRAIALAFAAQGADIACCDIDEKAAAETARLVKATGRKAFSRVCDVSSEADAKAAADATQAAFGRLDILVSGAAPHDPGGPVHEIPIAEWRQVVDINLTGSFLLSRAVVPHMLAGGGGSIIFIASQLARVGTAGRAAYCATKGALVQLAKVMAVDYAQQNIRVNALSPGAVETNRTLLRYGSFDAANATLGQKHLTQRLGKVDEIAPAAVFLASDAASFVTGSDLLVDGGYTAI